MPFTDSQKLSYAKHLYNINKLKDANDHFSQLSNSNDEEVKRDAELYLEKLKSKLND
ncbi:18003_t:CDS:1, partial [Cetraspora pellucida]